MFTLRQRGREGEPGSTPVASCGMKALRSFTVRPRLPEPLVALDRLASNLRWSWDRPTRDLFASIHPQSWDESGHDPRRVLAEVSTARLDELATDPAFLERLAAATASLDAYEGLPRWFQQSSGATAAFGEGVVAYKPKFHVIEVLVDGKEARIVRLI